MLTRLLLVALPALVGVAGAAAQPPARSSAALPLVFVGAGFGPSSRDAPSRMRLYEDEQATMWLIEGGVAVSERLGIGVEYSRPSAATAFTTFGAGRFQSSGRQEEQVLVGLLRARLAGAGVWAVDLVGGAGVLLQHHATGLCDPAQTVCEADDGPAVDERALTLVFGADLPLRLARHFSLVPAFRLYSLRRGDHTSETDINLPWQFEWQSSTRAAVLVSGRATW